MPASPGRKQQPGQAPDPRRPPAPGSRAGTRSASAPSCLPRVGPGGCLPCRPRASWTEPVNGREAGRSHRKPPAASHTPSHAAFKQPWTGPCSRETDLRTLRSRKDAGFQGTRWPCQEGSAPRLEQNTLAWKCSSGCGRDCRRAHPHPRRPEQPFYKLPNRTGHSRFNAPHCRLTAESDVSAMDSASPGPTLPGLSLPGSHRPGHWPHPVPCPRAFPASNLVPRPGLSTTSLLLL